VQVNGSISFWAAFDELAEDDPRRREILDIGFALTEGDPRLPGARPQVWPVGKASHAGYALELADGSGFLAYAIITHPVTRRIHIGLLYLVWY